jgi:hypothetical protein
VFRDNGTQYNHHDYAKDMAVFKLFLFSTILSTPITIDAATMNFDAVCTSVSAHNYFSLQTDFPGTYMPEISNFEQLDEYDDFLDILSYAHPIEKTLEVKLSVSGTERGGLNLPDELFEEFDYE